MGKLAIGAVTVVVYGFLLAIGFRIGQKTCEYVESGQAKNDFVKLKKITSEKIKEKLNDGPFGFDAG